MGFLTQSSASIFMMFSGHHLTNCLCFVNLKTTIDKSFQVVRHGPFDILGVGGGGLGFFSKKISLL